MTVRRRWLVALVGLLAGAALLLWVSAPAAKPGPGGPEAEDGGGGKPTVAVALGDSFISGEGGRWLGNSQNPLGDRDGTDRGGGPRIYGATDANGCHRSDVAPIVSAVQVMGPGWVAGGEGKTGEGGEIGEDRQGAPGGSAEPRHRVAEAVNLACSGARTRDLWGARSGGQAFKGEAPQADRLAVLARRRDIELVVLTATANDLGFADHVVDCVLAWSTSLPGRARSCAAAEQAEVNAGLGRARAGLAKAVRELRAALAAAGQPSGSYRLLVMGYASPIPAGRYFRYPQSGWERLTRGGCPFWDADADWANEGITPTMVGAMRSVAAQAGAEFLDVQRALWGHQVCDRRAEEVGRAGPAEASAEWARRLIPGCCQGSVQESLHPNAYGQRALGRCIALAWEQRPRPGGGWSCRARPRQGIGAIGLGALP